MMESLFLCSVILITLLVIIMNIRKKDNYQIIDVVKDVCKKECLDRGITYKDCNTSTNNKFMNNCQAYMVNLIGPLPSNVHLADIYAEYHTSP